jgi:hypothetical protein
MAVLWVVAPCSLVEFYQRFRGPGCLHHQTTRRYNPKDSHLHNFQNFEKDIYFSIVIIRFILDARFIVKANDIHLRVMISYFTKMRQETVMHQQNLKKSKISKATR